MKSHKHVTSTDTNVHVSLPLSQCSASSSLHEHNMDLNDDVKSFHAGLRPAHYKELQHWGGGHKSSHKSEITTCV